MGNELKSPLFSTHLAAKLGVEHRGRPVSILRICTINFPELEALMFSKLALSDLTFRCSILIAPDNSILHESCAHLVSKRPRLDFMRALCFLEETVGFLKVGGEASIHPTAIVSPYAVISENVQIGQNTVIEPHVYIHAGTRIGSNCLIRSGADIGGDGFGYERLDDGTPLKFVHLGGVRIGNYVEIGANTCVARGTLGDTLVDDYVKIDNLVHISHNCEIGRGAFVIAGAEVSGGVQIGAGAWVGPNAAIIQQVKIGAGATVGIGSVVTKDVPDHQTVAGSPADEISDFIRRRKLIAQLGAIEP
jgi:UDP-3-O-[3-hydroxymyristoyl] glucosamine N-acyltransferase